MEKASSNIRLNRQQIATIAMVVGGSLIASSAMALPSERREENGNKRGGEVRVYRTPERNQNYTPPQRQAAPTPAPVTRETAPPQQNTRQNENRGERFSQNNRPQPRDNNGDYRRDDNRGNDNRGGDNNYRGGNYNSNQNQRPKQPQYNNNYRPQPYNPQYNNNYRHEPQRDNDRRRFEFSNRSGNQYWGPNGNWTRWNYSWGDPNIYARRWGFDGYDARRGWRRGNTWYAYPSLWSNWGGWYSFFLSSGSWAFSYNDGYSPYGRYGDDCMRVQSRDWYRGGRAVVSYVVCENGWGDWREVPGTRQFEYWTY